MKTKSEKSLVLDVRPIFARGESPCGAIDDAVARLQPGQIFILLVPFEPVPLFAKLGRSGFNHKSEKQADGTWKIEFSRKEGGSVGEAKSLVSGVAGEMSSAGSLELDARGLEPPEPLVRTLEAVTKLSRGQRLIMKSDRRPLHLFTELDARGFAYDCTEQEDRSFITEIWQEPQ